MHYREFRPNSIFKNYVQCYFECENNVDGFTKDQIFATGFIEIMFNLGAHGPQQKKTGDLVVQPDIQLWGQTIRPYHFISLGKHSMFGIQFFIPTAACFFSEPRAGRQF